MPCEFELNRRQFLALLDYIITAVNDALPGNEFKWVTGRAAELEKAAILLGIEPPLRLHLDRNDPASPPHSISFISPDDANHHRCISVKSWLQRPGEPGEWKYNFGKHARGELLTVLRLWRVTVAGMRPRHWTPRKGPRRSEGVIYDDSAPPTAPAARTEGNNGASNGRERLSVNATHCTATLDGHTYPLTVEQSSFIARLLEYHGGWAPSELGTRADKLKTSLPDPLRDHTVQGRPRRRFPPHAVGLTQLAHICAEFGP